MVEIPTPKPYIFMIRVTRQIKCLIAQARGVIRHPLPEVNFLMVEIPTPKPYTCTCIFMIRVNRQIKCPRSWGPGSSPSPTRSFFENYTYLWNHLSILTKLCPNVPWVILFQNYVRHVWGPRGGLKWLVILIFKNLLLVNQQCQKIDTWHITLINLENRNPVWKIQLKLIRNPTGKWRRAGAGK